MNQKRPYRSDWQPNFLHEVAVSSTGKTYTLTPGTQVSVTRKPGLPPGRYNFLYAERDQNGQLMIQVERNLRRRIIRESDIKRVHVKTRRKPE